MSRIMMGYSIANQYAWPIGFDLRRYVTRNFIVRDCHTSFNAFIHEICSKYKLGEMQRPVDCQIVFTRLGDASPAMYLNTWIALPLSFTLAPIVGMQSLALWYPLVKRAEVIKERLPVLRLEPGVLSKTERQHIQTVVLLPTKAGEWLTRIAASLDQGESDTSHVYRQKSLDRIAMQNSLTGITSLAPQNTARPLYVIHAEAPHQRLQSVIGTERVRTAVALDHPQQEHLWPLTPLQPLTAVVSAQSTRRDVMAISQDSDRTPIGTFRYPGLQPVALVHVHRLATIFTKQTDFIPLQTSLSHSLSQAVQPPPKELQAAERWQPIADTWLAPLGRPRFGVSTIAVKEAALAHGVAHDLRQFTVLRQEERLEPQPLHYAFAQPMRPMAQDEQVVTKVHEKEVVKVVQQEVQSLMSSGSLVKYLSRADYTHIADNVYSSLARQLLVERERLGMR
jgi:hypothetical protein